MSRAPDIELSIDELVLHGLAPGDRHRIAAALERELGARLAAAPARVGASRRVGAVDAGNVQVAAGATPNAIGAAIGAAIGDRLAATLGPGGRR